MDYSKWNNIEISDDEDDTHPNIDKHSLFKWRHEARVQRMKEFDEKKKRISASIELTKKELDQTRAKLDTTKEKEKISKAVNELESKLKKLQKDEEDLKKEERLMPWNVDTISSEGWSKTKINKPLPKQDKSKLR